MRSLVIFTFVWASICCQPAEEPATEPTETTASTTDAFNAVDVDSDTHKVEFENEYVRIIRYRAPAGYTSNAHTHLGGIYVSLSDSKSSTTLESGETIRGESKFGDTGAFFEFAGVKHATANVGESDIEEILVEIKVEGGAPLDPPSSDAVQVDADHHTVEFENELVRVVRMSYPEGYATPPHNHYPGVNVLLTNVRASSGPPGQEVDPVENVAGIAAWAEAGEPHVTRNLGDTMEIVRVELKVH